MLSEELIAVLKVERPGSGKWNNALQRLLNAARTEALSARLTTPLPPITPELVNYIARYGGMCRNCADEDGICPGSGLPCDDVDKPIRHVLKALHYGLSHGYIPSARLEARVGEAVAWRVICGDMHHLFHAGDGPFAEDFAAENGGKCEPLYAGLPDPVGGELK